MSDNFSVDLRDLRKLQAVFKRMPNELPRSTASVLNGLAFAGRETTIETLVGGMILRNRKFIESSVQVQKTRPGRIESQVAYTGTVNRPRFTGLKEQETGEVPAKRKPASLAARGGSRRGTIKPHARFKSGRRFWRPEQFQGKTLQQRFQFMMRVLGSRGGQQQFFLASKIPTRRGSIGPGLFGLAKHQITRLRTTTAKNIKRFPWMEKSIQELVRRKTLEKLWGREVERLGRLYK